jgi:hypothetical protein
MMLGRRSAKRSRGAVSVLSIALALAWSVATHLLWQVEQRQGDDPSAQVRWVFSALEPSAWSDEASGGPSSETPRALTQPALPDGESPAPCQIRRSCSSDVEALAAVSLPGFAAPFERLPAIRLEGQPGVRSRVLGLPSVALHLPPPGRAPRPPPVCS